MNLQENLLSALMGDSNLDNSLVGSNRTEKQGIRPPAYPEDDFGRENPDKADAQSVSLQNSQFNSDHGHMAQLSGGEPGYSDSSTSLHENGIEVNAAPPWLRLSSTVHEAGLEEGHLHETGIEFAKISGLPSGWSIVEQGAGVDYGQVIQKDDVWGFELARAFDHSESADTEVLIHPETPFVIVRDAEGNFYDVPVFVSIRDDHPEIFSLADEYIERYQSDLSPKSASGILEMTFGADGPAAADAVVWDIASLGYLTSKGQPVELVQENGVLSATVHGKAVFTISLTNEGAYKYTQYEHLDSTSELSFNLMLKDADGDEQRVSEVIIIHIDTDVSDEPEIVNPDEDDRFVLYSDGSAESIDGKAVTGDVLANDEDPEAMLVSVTDGTFGSAVIEHGLVRYTLDQDAASRMPPGDEPVYDQLTYTAVDGRGNEYIRTIQIVVNRVNVSDEIYMSDNLIDGETHQSHISIEGDYQNHTPEIVGSDGSDAFTVNGSVSYASIDMGQGDNTIFISPGRDAEFAVKRSTLDTGSGNDRMTIAGLSDTTAINLGDGNNVFIASSANESTTTLSNASVVMGDGADRVRITNTISEEHLAPSGSISYTSTQLFALPGEDTGGTLDKGSSIDLGAGNNHLEILVNPDTVNASIQNHTSHNQRFQVYDDPYAAMNNGSSITSGSRDGEYTTIVIDSSDQGIANDSHLYVTGGNADIIIKTDRLTTSLDGGNLTVGLYNGSTIETADGQDTINMSSTGYVLYQDSHILTGDGNKYITLHSRSTETVMRDGSSVRTGAGDDTVSLTAGSAGGEVFYDRGVAKYDAATYAVLMENSFIDSGAGHNVISITSSLPTGINAKDWTGTLWEGGPYAASFATYAINDDSGIKAGLGTLDSQNITVANGSNAMGNGSYIQTGGGQDTISVTAGSLSGGHVKYGMFNNSTIDAGNGRNQIAVSSEDWAMSGTETLKAGGSYVTGDHYSGGSSITAGAGNDTISVTSSGRSGSAMTYSSFINAGQGNNVISVTNTNAKANFGIIHNSGILAGDGNNTVNVSSWTQAMHDQSYIRLGNGDNNITLTGTAYNASYALMSDGSLIHAGNGANTVTLTGPGHGMRNSSILAGDGGNTVSIAATQGTAMDAVSKIVSGGGNDSISLTGLTGVVGGSQITTGNGQDSISISVTGQWALGESQLDTGAGADVISFSSEQGAAVYASTIQSGIGDDGITVSSHGSHALHQTTLDAGQGDDSLGLEVVNAAGDVFGFAESRILMGEGQDSVAVSVSGINAVGMTGDERDSFLMLGGGNDSLEISALGSEYGSALTSSVNINTIDAGDGNDAILLRGSEYALDASGTGLNLILLGEGDDTITLDGFLRGTADQNSIDGGVGGRDELRLALDGTSEDDMMMLNGLTANASIANMENIVLDLFGRTEDPLELTQEHLNNLYKSGWGQPNEQGTDSDIYVYGTDYETLDISGTDGSWQQSGTAEYQGVTYDHWISDANQDLFVAQTILVITS